MLALYDTLRIFQCLRLACLIAFVTVCARQHRPDSPHIHPHLPHLGERVRRVIIVEYLAVVSVKELLRLEQVRYHKIKNLGRLHFRTSYGQNVLLHSKEVAILAGMIASEVGADPEIAKRGGLLHDIGKGAETESEANHAEIGAELAKRLGEDPKVVNCILAHHNDTEPTCPEAIIVQIADAISAARPGARRESLDNYIKRLESLENIAKGFDGVVNAFAIQAGRELRIMVNSDAVTDESAKTIARGIADRIEAELRYPGKIKVTIIRETRVVEYAK